MTTQVRETEQKYVAEAGVVLPSAEELEELPQVATVSSPKAETLVAEYFDTDDLRLLRAGVTLRRRVGGADEGWHLKLPVAGGGAKGAGDGATARREIRLTLDQGDRDRPAWTDRHGDAAGDPVPAALARLVRVHARGASLGPVARIETRRRTTTLRGADGQSLAEIAADEVAAQSLGASTILSRWNEIEVELTGGSARLLRATGKRLRRSGLRPAARAAKLERALALEPPAAGRGGTATATAGRRLVPRSTAGEVVLAFLGAQTARLTALDPAVRRDEADAIHQMRVAVRRLRATLQAFGPVLPEPATGHLRAELRWLGRVLGAARDQEVLEERFTAELDSTPVELVIGPVRALVTAHFAAPRAAAGDAVLRALDSPRYFAILDDLDRLLDQPPLTAAAAEPADDVLRKAVARTGQRTSHRMRRALRTPEGPARDVALHEARKAAKRARYAADAVRPAFGQDARRFAQGMKAVQSVLGDHQDAVITRAVARELGISAHLAGENAFTFGLLSERAHRDALEYQDQARSAWERAGRRRARRWPGDGS